MWQPPMEGEDMDETGSGNEQQKQQPVAVDKEKMELNSVSQSPAAEAEMTVDKVR